MKPEDSMQPLQRRFMDSQMVNLISQMAVMDTTLKNLDSDVKSIAETSIKIASGRPSWAVATILSLLTSAVAGLSVEVIHLLTRGN